MNLPPPARPSAPGEVASESGQDLPELMVVGRLVAPQGLRGELRAVPLTDFPQRFTHPGLRWVRPPRQPARPVRLLAGRALPGRELFVVRLEGVENRRSAEELVGAELLVRASDRPVLAPGEFHLLDLVGLRVRLLAGGEAAEGEPIGTVTDLLHAGNDLLEVELTGGRRVLVPFVEAIVPEVRIGEGWIGLTPPPGLLEL